MQIDGGTARLVYTLPSKHWFARAAGFSVARTNGAIAMALFYDESGKGNAAGTVVMIRSVDGSVRTVLKTTSADDLVLGVGWLPDGRRLIVCRTEPGNVRVSKLWRLDTESGEMTDLGVGMTALRDLQLSPDGRTAAFTAGQYSRHAWVLANFLPPTPSRTPHASRRTPAP
jgi:Tol biopolymer transport system component